MRGASARMMPIGALLLMTLLWMGVAAAQGAPAASGDREKIILVKGLTQGRAILEVDGELLMLSDGETRRGIRMIRADTRTAVMDVDGRRVIMGLDQSIARSYSAPEPQVRSSGEEGFLYREVLGSSTRESGRTRVRSVRLMENADSRVVVDVEYFYAGDHTGEVRLSVAPLRNDEALGFTEHAPSRLVEGERTTVVELEMRPDAPLVTQTDALKLTIAWYENGRQQGLLASRVVPFNKYWKRVRVR